MVQGGSHYLVDVGEVVDVVQGGSNYLVDVVEVVDVVQGGSDYLVDVIEVVDVAEVVLRQAGDGSHGGRVAQAAVVVMHGRGHGPAHHITLLGYSSHWHRLHHTFRL